MSKPTGNEHITTAGHRGTSTESRDRFSRQSHEHQNGLKRAGPCAYAIWQFRCFLTILFLFSNRISRAGTIRQHPASPRLATSKAKRVTVMQSGHPATVGTERGHCWKREPSPGPAQLGQRAPLTADPAGTAQLLPAQFSLISSVLHNTRLPWLLHSPLLQQDVFQLIRPALLFSQTHRSILPGSHRGATGHAVFCTSSVTTW